VIRALYFSSFKDVHEPNLIILILINIFKMTRVFSLHIETGGIHEWIELFYEWERCIYMSLVVLGTPFYIGNIKSEPLDKEGIERLIRILEEEEGNPNPMKELIKDDKQIEFLKPTYYENCSIEVLQNAVKLIYFHQVPSNDFLAHCSLCDEEFRTLMKKIKEENLPFKIYMKDDLWYDIVIFSNRARLVYLTYIKSACHVSKNSNMIHRACAFPY